MSKRRALTNLQTTGGAIIRFMKYASTQSDMAACGHALHRVIWLHEQHKEAMSAQRVVPPKQVPKAPDDSHAWDRGTRRPACVSCGKYQADAVGTPCEGDATLLDALSETDPELADHNWDTAEAFARKCRECGEYWTKANVPGRCPGKPEASTNKPILRHEWTDEHDPHPQRHCTACAVLWSDAPGISMRCPGKPEAPDTEHDWNTPALTAHRQCRTCEQFWLKEPNGSTCPGPPVAPKLEEHDWIPSDGTGPVHCRKCGHSKRSKAQAALTCPGSPHE